MEPARAFINLAGRRCLTRTSGRYVSATKQYPHRPGLASALGLRAGSKEEFVVSQTALAT
jgi:hypothetical protein